MERLLHGSGLTVPIPWKPYFNICFHWLPWWCLLSSFLLHTQWFENVLHHKIWCIAFCFVHITSVEYTSSHVFLWGVCMCARGCLKSTSEVIPQKLYLLERISQWDLRFPESVRLAGHGPMLGLWVPPSHLVCFLYVHITMWIELGWILMLAEPALYTLNYLSIPAPQGTLPSGDKVVPLYRASARMRVWCAGFDLCRWARVSVQSTHRREPLERPTPFPSVSLSSLQL